MSRIDRAEVERIAELARLELRPGEAQRMTADLEMVLGYVEMLQELDTQGIEPTSHAIPLQTPMRDDDAAPRLEPERALANAPQRDGFAFAVPKVLDEDEA